MKSLPASMHRIKKKMNKYNKVLDYASTHPNATVWYPASNMILMTDIDAAYLVLPEAHSCIAGYYYFTKIMLDYSKVTPTTNGPILTECNTLKIMVSSSAESEIGGTFQNKQNLITLRHILETITYIRDPPKAPQPSHTISHLKASSLVLWNLSNQKLGTWDIIG